MTACCGSSPGRPGPGSGRRRAAQRDRAPDRTGQPAAFLLHAPDRRQLAAALTRLADVAPWLSESELTDLSCQLIRDARVQGPARAGLVASCPAELAAAAREALGLLPGLRDGLLAARGGIFAADNADGRVTLLLSGEPHLPGGAHRVPLRRGRPVRAGRAALARRAGGRRHRRGRP